MTHAGMSIMEMLWEQADILYAQLMDIVEANETWDIPELTGYIDADGGGGAAQSIADYWELRGKLSGLTYALAKMQNPYESTKVQMHAVKQELMERWENAEEEE